MICYGLYGLGIESPWGRDFPHPSRTAIGCVLSLTQLAQDFSPRVKRWVRGVDCSPPSSAEVIEGVQLYLYFLSGPSWPVLGWTLHFTLTFCHLIFFWRDSPQWVMASSLTRFLYHTQRRTTVGRTLWTSDQLVAETSTWQHTTLTTDNTSMPPVGFEPTISAGERPQT